MRTETIPIPVSNQNLLEIFVLLAFDFFSTEN